ncbi:S8 family peptidase [Hymenobacter sp. PAMC 26628]|uniref:S8 family peptidase n=1 Tax=Hymenobacter sp. PAMC 26628 TaxID=1484118 RepID=UPI0007704283|nr:S8 family peptidase [Hymenobacter sp. PAMC 26628]AMJ65656.1 peptidase S8/S53 subtilisin kexin sedolisin [Hymenobacter sp. PAMC 26628]
MADSPQKKPEKKLFDPANLAQTVIAVPLLQQIAAQRPASPGRKRGAPPAAPRPLAVIIDLNLEYPGGRAEALKWVLAALDDLGPPAGPGQAPAGQAAGRHPKNQYSQQYLFVRLDAAVIEALVARDRDRNSGGPLQTDTTRVGPKAIYRIWPDFPIRGLLNRSLSTVKGDAAHASYAAFGAGIVWAVLDSGIDGAHPHFATYHNLDLPLPLRHIDFTGDGDGSADAALRDGKGHGTHVAGIIAGAWPPDGAPLQAFNRRRDEQGEIDYVPVDAKRITGIAPQCKLVSLKVMDDQGAGEASNLIAAIGLIQEINGYGRRLLIHGANLSVGYEFDPEWFACGQSPLCVEVNRLVRSGVAVVVAAGNTGYGAEQSQFNGTVSAGMGLTINDPGNADLALTVGSTHRDMPHVYGVSYFSSKGPTGDGRVKPDLVAPGEKILSCAAGTALAEMQAKGRPCDYVEDSGTSMAAPHVSGAIAAFLSIRREFVGEPEKVKDLFTASATDLKRERHFQGAGLVDLMRAIQSV